MRKLWPALLLPLASAPVALAGTNPLLSGCQLTSANPTVASSASDSADCVFAAGQWYKFQCDASVYYRSDGTDPTTTSQKVTFPGEPEPFTAKGGVTAQPLKVLAVAGTAVCNVFLAD
jgi:hypothetical protein